MKIAFIYPRFTGPYGGERLLFKLAGELIDAGCQVTVYASGRRTEVIDEIKPAGMELRVTDRMNFGHQLNNLLDFFKMPFVAHRISRDYDYVIGMGWQTALCLAVMLRHRRFDSRRIVYYCLEPPRFLYDLKDENSGMAHRLMAPLFALIRFLDGRAVKAVPRCMAISDWTAAQMKSIYGKNTPIIYPGVEMDRFKRLSKARARKKLGLDAKAGIYLSVSKLHPRKKLSESIDIYLKRRARGSRYFIIGGGPDHANIERYIQKSGSGAGISLLGKLSDDQVTDYMKAADYFIFTAINEPFGIAPLEAKVAGCKILPRDFKRPILPWKEVGLQFLEALKNPSR